MVKKPAAKKKSTKAKPGPHGDPRNAIIDAALTLAGQLGWAEVRLDDIADSAGLSMADMYRVLPSKTAIVAAYMQRVDEAVGQGGLAERDEPVKDRLFEIIMRRFDALQADRDGVAGIVRATMTDPAALLCLFGLRNRSLKWMLELAALGSDGFKGRMRARGLELIMLSTTRVWLKDDSQDMSVTMAHLDRQLGRANQFVATVLNWGRRGPDAASDTA